MPRFAQFDPAAPEPAPVIGWYDAELLTYPNLPPDNALVALTQQQWDDHFADTNAWAVQNGALVAYTPPPPPPTPDSLLAGKIALGIAITCTGTPAVSATYALDALTLDQIGAVARDFMAGLGLPFDAETFAYPDQGGRPHTFSGVQIAALYKAMRDLIAQLNQQAAVLRHGGEAVWPTQAATIA